MKKVLILISFLISINGFSQIDCTDIDRSSVTLTNVTTPTTLDIEWYGRSNDIVDPLGPSILPLYVKYGLKGFDPNNSGFLKENVRSPLHISGLNPNTTYEFYFFRKCIHNEPLNFSGTPFEATTMPAYNNDCIAIKIDEIESTTTINSATIDWVNSPNNPSFLLIKYGAVGFDPSNSGVPLNNITLPYTVNGLMPNTTYDFYAFRDCSGTLPIQNGIPLKVITKDKIIVPPPTNETPLSSGSFKPNFNQKYVISAWVREKAPSSPINVPNYSNSAIRIATIPITTNNEVLNSENQLGTSNLNIVGTFYPKGNIIDGWQRIEGVFEMPMPMQEAIDFKAIIIELMNTSQTSGQDKVLVYFDDVRVFPFNGSMKSFVYDNISKKLMAELDENNFATYYEYDKEGGLIRVKKETHKGIYTIQETRSSNAKKQ